MAKKILLIEHDEILRRFLVQKIIKEGYLVDESADASEALHIIYERQPHGVLLDLGDSGGIELLRERKMSPLLLRIPFIIIVHPGQEKEEEIVKRLGTFVFAKEEDLMSSELLKIIHDTIGPPH